MSSPPASPSSDTIKESEGPGSQSKELVEHAVPDKDHDKVMVRAVVDEKKKKKKKKTSGKKKATGFEGTLSPAVEAVISVIGAYTPSQSDSYIDRILLRAPHDACRT